MRQVLLIVDVQPTFSPPDWLVDGISELSQHIPAIATIELHDEKSTPFLEQLGWAPAIQDVSLIKTEHVFIKHGYAPSEATLRYLKSLNTDRVLVCGIQTETCVLAAGFALFDLGLRPTLLTDLTVGSSLDRSGQLGVDLWKHHFRSVATSAEIIAELRVERSGGSC